MLESNVSLGTFDVDVNLLQDGTFDVYLSHAGSSGEHYEHVTAKRIGELVADDIECIAENYGNVTTTSVKTVKGTRDPYKVDQIDAILDSPDFYAYLSGGKTSGAKTINLDGYALKVLKALYEGKTVTIKDAAQ